ncbi:FCS-Like Zinc finger 17 [Canna indica]|uniref:FCS-Like Zinc finger 17 n=1 Tax=Canna indica TaxID=4628 RepID=A0AAQ3KN92_9LILI|nr:FCS-Like Zinc finger 17 [Canna indica]
MLSRNKGIFHLGEDVGEATRSVMSNRGSDQYAKRALKGVEGLLILIDQREKGPSNVVIKSAVSTCKLQMPQACNLCKGLPELSFLKSCFFCRKELNPSRDVYMYRGDQGFCSEECRSHLILRDEREEFEISIRDRLKAPHRRRLAGDKCCESDRDRRILAVV